MKKGEYFDNVKKLVQAHPEPIITPKNLDAFIADCKANINNVDYQVTHFENQSEDFRLMYILIFSQKLVEYEAIRKSGKWEYKKRTIYTYDTSGNIIEAWKQVLIKGKWMDTRKVDYNTIKMLQS